MLGEINQLQTMQHRYQLTNVAADALARIDPYSARAGDKSQPLTLARYSYGGAFPKRETTCVEQDSRGGSGRLHRGLHHEGLRRGDTHKNGSSDELHGAVRPR